VWDVKLSAGEEMTAPKPKAKRSRVERHDLRPAVLAPSMPEAAAWQRAAEEVRANPDLRENLIQSVLTSMALEGFDIDYDRAQQLLDDVLSGPPLELHRDA